MAKKLKTADEIRASNAARNRRLRRARAQARPAPLRPGVSPSAAAEPAGAPELAPVAPAPVHETTPISDTLAGVSSPDAFSAIPILPPAPVDDGDGSTPAAPDGADLPPEAVIAEPPQPGPTEDQRRAAAERFAAAIGVLVVAGVAAGRDVIAASALDEPWRGRLASADPSAVLAHVHAAAIRVGMKYDFVARLAIPYEDEIVVGGAALASVVALLWRRRLAAAPAPHDVRERASAPSLDPAPSPQPPTPAAPSADWSSFGMSSS